MIRILGNSTERIQLKDLNDVIYYKQVKEFTDSEYATSKDLKREIQAGRIVQLEKTEAPRGSEDTVATQAIGSGSSVSLSDIRALLREVLPTTSNGEELKKAVVEAVRQELSKIPVQQVMAGGPYAGGVPPSGKSESSFQEPTYIPTVSSKGMVSNVEATKTEASSNDANEALKALRNLNKIGS